MNTEEKNQRLAADGDENPTPPAPEFTDLVAPERVKVWEDAFKILHVRVDDRVFDQVRPRRIFPLSGKADYVSFLDRGGHEVLLLAAPHKLDRESRAALEHALSRLYYAAEITRIDSISENMGVSRWHVMTNRGYATFEITDRQRNIRIMPDGRYLLTDADGNRFEITAVARLDPRSQVLVEMEV